MGCSMRILLIEDDEDILFIFREYLINEFNSEVQSAGTIMEVKQIIVSDTSFDITFVDFYLRGKPITAIMEDLLVSARLGKIVLMSASPKQLDKYMTVPRLIKPFHLKEVDQYIHSCLNVSQSAQLLVGVSSGKDSNCNLA